MGLHKDEFVKYKKKRSGFTTELSAEGYRKRNQGIFSCREKSGKVKIIRGSL